MAEHDNNKKFFSIVICALNEEKSIGKLLQDILDQKPASNFILENIVVVSDGSTDKTEEIVVSFIARNDKIVLLKNEKRQGKFFALDRAFNYLQSEFVIMFDADVRLNERAIDFLLSPLSDHCYDLIGGNPVPYEPASLFNVAEQASYFSWRILREIKRRFNRSIYCAHGRILCLSKQIYKNSDIKDILHSGDDQLFYIKSAGNFLYVEKAVVFYKMPATIRDYLNQNVRFRRSSSLHKFESTEDYYKLNGKPAIFIKIFLAHPYQGLAWLFLFSIGYLEYLFIKNKEVTIKNSWQEARSTK
ncbi:MAG: glycosyltransferase [Patescibacteria group bacterium]